MTGAAVQAIIWIARLFGVNLSGFAGGAILAAAVAAVFASYSGYLVHTGYEWAQGKCQAEALRKENEQLVAELAEKRRSLALVNAMQERDAQRAAEAETKLRENESNVNATPANSGKCLDSDAAHRVRDVR